MNDTLKSFYETAKTTRDPYVSRARSCSELTIPALVPPEGATGSTEFPTPYQSLGARGVNNMASRLTLTLLPPNQPMFKEALDDRVRQELGAKIGEVEKALSQREQAVMKDIEGGMVRPAAFNALKHLLVAGNVLTYDDPSGRMRVYPITQYVCQRRPDGTPYRVVLHELISKDSVPDSIRRPNGDRDADTTERHVDLFTGIMWDTDGSAQVHQEIYDQMVPGSDGFYPADTCPWNPMRMIVVEGEDYGRSYAEEYAGDLITLENLTRALVLGTSAAARVVYLVAPGGSTRQKHLQDAETGDVIIGREEDVSVLRLDKHADFKIAEERIQKLTDSLSFVFLLNSAIQRPGERVTASEIRFMAQELESQLGGLYSSLSVEFQLPLVKSRIHKLVRSGRLAQLPKNAVSLSITTGVDALGRGNDFDRLTQLTEVLTASLGPDAVAKRLDTDEFTNRLAASLGINTEGLLRTDEELREMEQRAQMAAMQQAAVAPTINQMGRAATQAQPPASPTQ